MSAMSASPPVGLPLSLIAEHKVSGSKAPPAPTSAPQQVASIPTGTPPSAPTNAVAASQPQTNGMEPAVPAPAVPAPAIPAPAVPAPAVPAPAVPALAIPAPPQVSSSPSPPPSQPQPALSTVANNAQGGQSVEGSVGYAPGSGTCGTSGGNSEVEVNSAAVGDIPPLDAQPSVPPTQATIPTQPVVQEPAPPVALPSPAPQPAEAAPPAPVEASPPPSAAVPPTPPQPSPSKPSSAGSSKPPVPANKPLPTPPVASPTKPVTSPTKPNPPATKSSPAPTKPTPPSASKPPPSSPSTPTAQVESTKPSRTLKRKAQPTDGEASTKKAPKVEESTKMDVDEDSRKSKRSRLPTQPYQSPIPELNIIAKMNNTPKPSKKASEEKLIVFYRNEFLAVRNAEGGFYVCQTMQNIYRSGPGPRSKIKIRWFSQGPNDVFTPDFYDSTEFDCILTNLNLDRLEKDKYKLPPVEKQRTESILKRAIDAEKGEAADQALTEEHPDGLDLSLYRHEDQLKKRGKNKKEPSKKKSKSKSPVKPPVEVKKPTRVSARNSGGQDEPVKEKTKTNEKNKSRSSKKKKLAKKNDKGKKKEVEVVNNKKENVENAARKNTNSGATPAPPARKTADKTKSAGGAKQTNKAPAGVTKQPSAQRSSRTSKQ